jgi:hypothetical protein
MPLFPPQAFKTYFAKNKYAKIMPHMNKFAIPATITAYVRRIVKITVRKLHFCIFFKENSTFL